MKKEPNRKLFSLMLSPQEKNIITTQALAMGVSANAYIRFMVFRSAIDLTSERSPLANNAVSEINVKTYSALCDIVHSLREIKQLVESDNEQCQTLIMVDRTLLEETLKLVKKIALQIAFNKN